ncbi:MAG: hypothetical protein CMK89_00985 [Pseudomonadales bacterium]|nr:hypothetical protein [Pseudomonadales bacterium]
MAYKATVLPVMIASPGDVSEERDITRQIIHDWNDINSEKSKIMLSAVGWDSHSSPELGARPQELINQRVLRYCDILIGIFWTRLGTPTGKALSGTVEEIEEHVAAGKPAMIYFSSKPVSPESIDAEQYKRVREARSNWQQRGLVETYDTLEQFRQKLSKQFQLCLNKNQYINDLIVEADYVPEIQKIPNITRANSYSLTEDSISLLKAASSDEYGSIMKVEYIGGQEIQAGGKSFGKTNRKEFTRWESALNTLVSNSLVTTRGHKGEFFELTHEGWTVAESL